MRTFPSDRQLHRADVSYCFTPARSYPHYQWNREKSESVSVAYDFDTVDAAVDAPDWIDE